MDYEKAYKEALERAKGEWVKNLDNAYKNYRERLEIIFPELKESEDERIRKALIKGVECCKASGWTNFGNNVDIDVVLAWLEKQGEQKPVDKVEPFDKYEGLTDFERTLADICIGWIGEEIGWKDYIIKNSLPLLEIAKRQYNKEYLFSQCSKI